MPSVPIDRIFMGPGDALDVYGEEKVIFSYRVSKFGPPSMV
jgi:hypothetical protein